MRDERKLCQQILRECLSRTAEFSPAMRTSKEIKEVNFSLGTQNVVESLSLLVFFP